MDFIGEAFLGLKPWEGVQVKSIHYPKAVLKMKGHRA
jgi:hypothetical protein